MWLSSLLFSTPLLGDLEAAAVYSFVCINVVLLLTISAGDVVCANVGVL